MKRRWISCLMIIGILCNLCSFALPVGAAEAQEAAAVELLNQLPYVGEASNCKMDAAMAQGYAEALEGMQQRTAPDFRGESCTMKPSAILIDLAGDGMPILLTYYEYEASGRRIVGSSQPEIMPTIWTWDGSQAVPQDELFITEGPSYKEALEETMEMGYSGESARSKFAVAPNGNAYFVAEYQETVCVRQDENFEIWGEASHYLIAYQIQNGQLQQMEEIALVVLRDENGMLYDAVADTAPMRLQDGVAKGFQKVQGVFDDPNTVWEYVEYPTADFYYALFFNGQLQQTDSYEDAMSVFSQYASNHIREPYADPSTEPLGGLMQQNYVASSDIAATLRAYADLVGRPSYTFEEVSGSLTPAQVEQIAQALAQQFDGTVGEIYRLGPDLYYVIVYVGGQVSGGAVVKETVNGVRVVVTHEEPAEEVQLQQMAAADQQTPNLTLDFNAGLQDPAGQLQTALENIDGTEVNDAAKQEIVLYMENMLRQLTQSYAAVEDGLIQVDLAQLQQAILQAEELLQSMMDVLGDTMLNKPVTVTLQVFAPLQSWETPVTWKLDADLLEAMEAVDGLQLLLGDGQHTVTVTRETLTALLESTTVVVLQIVQTDGKYEIIFSDGEGNAIAQLPVGITLSLPAASETATILVTYAGGSDNWGGQYDAINGALSFSTPYTGTYEVVENAVEITDLGTVDEETADAIAFMVSKGYFTVDETGAFRPDGPLKRYDFSKALVSMFFALDRGLTTDFTDVETDSMYYPYVASGQQRNILLGYEDQTFRGEQNVVREQLIALCSRTLADQKGYSYPTDTTMYLQYSDCDAISDWALETTALAVREQLLTGNGVLNPQGEITRAEAALMLYRLFMLLYEPPAVKLTAAGDAASAWEMDFDREEQGAPVVAIAAGVLVVAAAVGGGWLYRKKRK